MLPVLYRAAVAAVLRLSHYRIGDGSVSFSGGEPDEDRDDDGPQDDRDCYFGVTAMATPGRIGVWRGFVIEAHGDDIIAAQEGRRPQAGRGAARSREAVDEGRWDFAGVVAGVVGIDCVFYG